MTNYVFESMTAEQAAAFVSTDTLTFSTPGATARAVTLTLVPYVAPNFFEGEVGSTPSVTISFGGKTVLFYNGFWGDALKDWNKDEKGLKPKADGKWNELTHAKKKGG